MNMKYISSPRNDALKQYKKLSSSRRERTKQEQFVLEGVRLVTDCANASGCYPEQLFVTEEALGRFPDRLTEDFISHCADAAVISPECAAAISQTDTPQGVYAVCRMLPRRELSEYGGGRILIADDLQDPGNLGTIIRTADAFGLSLALCNCCDVYSPKTVRSAMGSILRVPVYRESFEDTIAALKAKGIRILAAVPSDTAVALGSCSLENTAVVIGNEGSGISAEHIALCDGCITIRMSGNAESLNAAVAAAIFMYSVSQ